VVAVGSLVTNFKVGDYVACAGANFANHAEFVNVPVNLAVKIMHVNFLKQASITTIGAIAMQGVRRANLALGEKVCVVGLGLLGQLTLQMAKLAGCFVIAIDLNENRLALAKKLGADLVINPSGYDLLNEVMFKTLHQGVDASIITAASNSGEILQQAMQLTRRKGRVVLVGDVKIDFDRDPFYSKEIDFVISCSYGPGRYDDKYEREGQDYPYAYVRWTENRNLQLFVELIEAKKIDIDSLISDSFDINNVSEAYASLQNKNSFGLVLSYGEFYDEEKSKKIELLLPVEQKKKYVAPVGKLKMAAIGVGGFSKIKLLPLISKIKNVEVHTIVDTNTANSLNVAQRYDANCVSNDFKAVLSDDQINAVVIATPHCLHAQQAIDCADLGKAVFVEKPAAVTFEQLNMLEQYFQANKKTLYCVDFNRSFAPFIKPIKEVMLMRTNPAVIQYRMNAGYISTDHWIQSATNRGRAIGEACHIFDLFCFLTDSFPLSVSVQPINSKSQDILSNDNFVAQLQMADGSCCSLTYTAIGSNKMSKERLELFVDGKSVVMDDFVKLEGFGLPSKFNRKSTIADKGHAALLNKFFEAAAIANFEWPIPRERIMTATKLSLIVDKLCRAGGGFERLD
jgi:predicted dehydrogenase/NADPH:quinone reductase-like Zn-dependent oxidoreductase